MTREHRLCKKMHHNIWSQPRHLVSILVHENNNNNLKKHFQTMEGKLQVLYKGFSFVLSSQSLKNTNQTFTYAILFSLFCILQHLQGAQPWMDNLGRMLNKINTIERHMKYLQCLQHIEELRYCEIIEMKTLMSCQRQIKSSWLNRPTLNAHLHF